MSFLDGKQRIATIKDVNGKWSGGKPGEFFRCAFCGYKFVLGDKWRCQYTNDIPGAWGNPLICEKCDGTKEEVVEKWKKMHQEVKEKYWWFCR